MTQKKVARRYGKAWALLKTHGTVRIEVTNSTNPSVFENHVSTIIRGIQKEKYLDVAFKRKYPDAKITTTQIPSERIVQFTLQLNDLSGLEELSNLNL